MREHSRLRFVPRLAFTIPTRLTPEEVVAALSPHVTNIDLMDPLEMSSALMGYGKDIEWIGEVRTDGFTIQSPLAAGKPRDHVPVILGALRKVERGTDVEVRTRVHSTGILLFAACVAFPLLSLFAIGLIRGTLLYLLLIPPLLLTVTYLIFLRTPNRAERFLRERLPERDPVQGGPYRAPAALPVVAASSAKYRKRSVGVSSVLPWRKLMIHTRLTSEQVVEALSKDETNVTKMSTFEVASAHTRYPKPLVWARRVRRDGFRMVNDGLSGSGYGAIATGSFQPVADGTDITIRMRARMRSLLLMAMFVAFSAWLVAIALSAGRLDPLGGLLVTIPVWALLHVGFLLDADRAERFLRERLPERDALQDSVHRSAAVQA